MKKTCKMETFLPSLLSFYILSKPLQGFSQNLSRDQYLWPVKQIKTSFTQASRIISLITTAERRKHFGLTISFFLLQNSLRLKVEKKSLYCNIWGIQAVLCRVSPSPPTLSVNQKPKATSSVICANLTGVIRGKPPGSVIKACTRYSPKQEERQNIAIFLLFTQILRDLRLIYTKTVSRDKYLAVR